jgi:hypothetical protein
MVVSVPVEPGGALRFGAPRELFRLPPNLFGWSPTRDGERFLVTVPADKAVRGISVAVNWRSGSQP